MTEKEETQLNVLKTLRILDIIGYSFVLAFTLYNTWVFLIIHGKARIFLVTVFYVLTVTICVSRIIDSVATMSHLAEKKSIFGTWVKSPSTPRL